MIEATSCGGVVIFRGKILVLYKNYRNKYEGWVLPKGTVEAGEEFKETALREVKEETGLDIQLEDGFRQAVEYFPKPNVKKQVVYFLGQAQSLEIKRQKEEISRITWTDIHKAYHMVTFKNDRDLIAQASQRLQSCV